MIRFFYVSLTLWLFLLAVNESAQAQWSVGGGYELREENPAPGYNIRLQREFLRALPFTHLAVRSHFSFFSENQNAAQRSGSQQYYTVGVETIAGINMGISRPYAGIGIGYGHTEFFSEGEQANSGLYEENLTLNGFLGAEIQVLPFINPFIEYKFSQFIGTEHIENEQSGSLSLGLMLYF